MSALSLSITVYSLSLCSSTVQPVTVPTSNMWGGVTIISHPTLSDATSVISHALVPVVDETDGAGTMSTVMTTMLHILSL